MLSKIQKILPSLDAFPKVEANYLKQTTSGGIVTLLVSLLMCALTFSELADYLQIVHDYEFMVDQTVQQTMTINVDITFAMPCDFITVDVQDVSGDSLHAKHQLTHQAVQFDSAQFLAHKQDMAQEVGSFNIRNIIRNARRDGHNAEDSTTGNGCRIYGQLDVNKVAGNLHFTALGHGHFGQHAPHEAINFGHHIDKLSFGADYPGLINPLDQAVEIAETSFEMYQYFLSVVPTIYIDRWDNILVTNQFAVTNHHRVIDHDHGNHGVPGVFIKYDLESILVRVTERKNSFLHFFVRVCGIVGGLFATTGMIHQFVMFLGRTTREYLGPRQATSTVK